MGVPKSTEFRWNPNEYRYADENSLETESFAIAAGQVLAAGAVLGRIDATQQYVACAKTDAQNNAVADGSQKARVVLAVDVDTSAGQPKNALTYTKGSFSQKWLRLGHGHTFATVEDDLRGLGIYFRAPAIPAVG